MLIVIFLVNFSECNNQLVFLEKMTETFFTSGIVVGKEIEFDGIYARHEKAQEHKAPGEARRNHCCCLKPHEKTLTPGRTPLALRNTLIQRNSELLQSAKKKAEDKLKEYSAQASRKQQFHKLKEAEEAKKKREEEDAKLLLREFTASFDDNPSQNSPSWVSTNHTSAFSRPILQDDVARGRNIGLFPFMRRENANSTVNNANNIQDFRPHSRAPFNAQTTTPVPGTRNSGTVRSEVMVKKPKDEKALMLIHRMIERVIIHGPDFESLVMEKEKSNEEFRFLFISDMDEHIYYRWKLYSILQGDSINRWRIEPFKMFDEGPVWIPPEVPFVDNDDDDVTDSDNSSTSSEPSRPSRPSVNLPTSTLRKIEESLRRLNQSRFSIGALMHLSIQHSSHAIQITNTIVSSLLLPNTTIFPNKLARLFLLSDILHNSSSTDVPFAWKYRTAIEARLPELFRHFGRVHKTIKGRLRAEQWRKAVFSVVAVWESWEVFPKQLVDQLRSEFSDSHMDTSSVSSKLMHSSESQKQETQGFLALEDAELRQKVIEVQSSLDGDEFMPNQKKSWKPIEASWNSSAWSSVVDEVNPAKSVDMEWKPIFNEPSWKLVDLTEPDTNMVSTLESNDDDDDEDIDGVPIDFPNLTSNTSLSIEAVNAPVSNWDVSEFVPMKISVSSPKKSQVVMKLGVKNEARLQSQIEQNRVEDSVAQFRVLAARKGHVIAGDEITKLRDKLKGKSREDCERIVKESLEGSDDMFD
ncbi:U2 snRNP-associated SURP domain-containing protein [Nowakowskiella sp. JEL0078]|nr:U2 snRNP-associated SURP domain-containing protein [Nowakowskiella sp. JEL0078]